MHTGLSFEHGIALGMMISEEIENINDREKAGELASAMSNPAEARLLIQRYLFRKLGSISSYYFPYGVPETAIRVASDVMHAMAVYARKS